MKKRNPAAVFLLPFITFGIYSWYWAVKTKGEMNKLGEHIPTAWLWLIPIVGGVWWWWKYSEAVEHVTKDKVNAILAFLLLFLTGNIGQAILQTYYNDMDSQAQAEPVATNQPSPVPSAPAAPAPDKPESGNNPPASPIQ